MKFNAVCDTRSKLRHRIDKKLGSNQDLGVKVATPVGNVFGQVFFGWLADHLGRKRMCRSLHYPSLSDFLILFKMV